MIQATINQNPLSVADLISLQKPNNKDSAQQPEIGFKSNLDDQLAQAGGIEGVQANLAAVLAPQVQPQLRTIQKSVDQPQAFAQLQAKGAGIDRLVERPGKEINARMDLADYLPTTARVNSGVTAGSTIAGLKPWDHEWVFEGNPNPDARPDVNPLIGPSNTQAALAEMQEALAQLRPSSMNPGAAQVSQSLPQARTRGDLDIANALVANQADPAERMRMAQVAGALAGNLGQQLKAMNGQMVEVSGEETAKAAPAQRKVALLNGQLAGGSGLSGAEFMNTLSAVRPNPLSGGNTGGESMKQDQGNWMTSGGPGPRPELKVIDGAKTGKGLGAGDDLLMSSPVGLHALNPTAQPQQQQSQAPMLVTGQVVPGSMARDQLAHDAIQNVANGIRNMSVQGGGEMRIRLKPENLGELQLRVVSQGNEVGIHIQASDDKAKKILQESLGSLKDSLSAQSITLGKVAIEVAKASGGHDMRNDSSSQQHASQHRQGDQFGFGPGGQHAGNQRNQREAQWSDPESPAVAARPLKSAAQTAMSGSNAVSSRTEDGRLDVMA